jgi:hypothetical protein
LVFVETSAFSRHLGAHLNDDDYGLLQKALIEYPVAGAIIKGSGGLRKLRWASGSQGKSGGARIIYYWVKGKDQILLLAIYSKSDKADLTKKQIKAIRKLVEELEDD